MEAVGIAKTDISLHFRHSIIDAMSQRAPAPGGPKVKRVMTQAINLIFEFLKNVGNLPSKRYSPA
jgi:hypothetical protein